MEPGMVDAGGILLGEDDVTLFELGEVLSDTKGVGTRGFTEGGGAPPFTHTLP